MIKNNKQLSSAKDTLNQLTESLKQIVSQKKLTDSELELHKKNYECLIQDLQQEILKYESLLQEDFYFFNPGDLEDLNEILIGARIAKRLTQRELADMLGIQEQQIQRYEATDYESATWTRIQEVAYALQLNFKFEKVGIQSNKPKFLVPSKTSPEEIMKAKIKIRQSGSLHSCSI